MIEVFAAILLLGDCELATDPINDCRVMLVGHQMTYAECAARVAELQDSTWGYRGDLRCIGQTKAMP